MMAMTLSFSRAIVHSAWMVYIAEPSPISASTGRSGQAMAAPTALGRPWPMAPPVRVIRSWRGAPAVMTGQHQPGGDAPRRPGWRCRAAGDRSALQTLSAVSLPARTARALAGACSVGRGVGGTQRARPASPGCRARPASGWPARARCSCPAPGSSSCRGRRRTTPAPWRRPGSGCRGPPAAPTASSAR